MSSVSISSDLGISRSSVPIITTKGQPKTLSVSIAERGITSIVDVVVKNSIPTVRIFNELLQTFAP